jgi:hypothetical protein
MVCGICNKNHATILHNPEYKNKQTTHESKVATPVTRNDTSTTEKPGMDNLALTSSSTNSSNNKESTVNCTGIEKTTYSMVVPVYVSAGGIEKLVYALLDNGSDSCYIDKHVAKEIGATGKLQNVKMQTMNAITDETLTFFTDLNIRGYLNNNTTSLDAYEKDYINCDRSHIPTRDKCSKLPHLQRVASQIPSLLDIPIGLLIGADCPQAIHYKESLDGPDGEPFAAKTMFGWTLCGGKSSYLNQISCLNTQRKDNNAKEIFKMVEQDFKDVAGKPMSQQDLKFLHILNNGISQDDDGSYVMPLPFKSLPSLPNNRQQAEQRLRLLKTKLLKDPYYKEDYRKFMNTLL